jgi:hypothetical protein
MSLGMIGLVAWSVQAMAQSRAFSARDVQAAYLYQFGRYVQWPATASLTDRFEICILGSDPFDGSLDEVVRGQRIGPREVSVRRVTSATETGECQILFISSSESARTSAILNVLRGQPVLTVADDEDFIDRGGMVAFVSQGNRVRFAINQAAANAAQLRLSSQLLRLAVTVQQ